MSMTTRASPMGGNVVPFDTTTPPPTPVPWPPGPWPFPPGALPGCAPPGGMDSLMSCYWSVQQATAFISAIMIDAINNNPAVTDAIIAAIEKSGSNLPLIGVTNGTDAQPGQVGEFVQLSAVIPFPATGSSTVTGTMGILQPGDWDIWMAANTSVVVADLSMAISPTPVGFSGVLDARVEMPATAGWQALPPALGRASISVPTLVPMQIGTNWTGAGTGAGNCNAYFFARRRR